jgi:protein-S-isoprenylcysteine O-methyltransferase Ste14
MRGFSFYPCALHNPSSISPDVANRGIVRPPFVYIATIAAGWILGYLWPLRFVSGGVGGVLGSLLILAAVILFFSSGAKFRAAGTPVPGNRPSTSIVRAGPYRFSRNPIYLAFSLLQLGLAVWTGNLWMIATLVIAVGLMAAVVIPREEEYLERKFGAEYLDYKATVRRWL